ncbi:MAG TPA: hypothetical protein VH370_08730 [Humisphaera sp.]|jgi:hypothetical protein|nr:hypothetical protein [Humisphaera sp.]
MAKLSPLHKQIGKIVRDIFRDGAFPDCELKEDPACGGAQNLPLFCSHQFNNATEFCNVDLLVLRKQKIRILIEIEEANVKPVQICGKLMASALCRFHTRKRSSCNARPMANGVLFLQILDTKNLKASSRKRQQWHQLERAIKSVLPLRDSRVNNYRIFTGSADCFRDAEPLVASIRDALAKD